MEDSEEHSAASPPAGRPWIFQLKRLFSGPGRPPVRAPAARMPTAIDALRDGLVVLVADDNPLNRMVACEMLACFGICPLQAADGAEAVLTAARVRLDLILMDLQMPVLDGLGATRQIRRAEQEQTRGRVPVVAYTSASRQGLRWSEFGIDDVLDKPCERQAMQECLLRWCAAPGGAQAPSGIGLQPSH
jgi:CheY-like chemotaxis protein